VEVAVTDAMRDFVLARTCGPELLAELVRTGGEIAEQFGPGGVTELLGGLKDAARAAAISSSPSADAELSLGFFASLGLMVVLEKLREEALGPRGRTP
jgi:hypothetical protein